MSNNIPIKWFFLSVLDAVNPYGSFHKCVMVKKMYIAQYVHEGIAAYPVHSESVNTVPLSNNKKLTIEMMGQI